MEVGVRPDGRGVEATASRGDGGVERVQAGEVLVDHRLVDQRPEVLGRLQLRGVAAR